MMTLKHTGAAVAAAVVGSLASMNGPALAEVTENPRDLSGALVNYKAPAHDGPVPFLTSNERMTDASSNRLIALTLGGAVGFGIACWATLAGAKKLEEKGQHDWAEFVGFSPLVGAPLIPGFLAGIAAVGINNLAGFGSHPIGELVSITTNISHIDKEFGGAASSVRTKHGVRYGGPYVMQLVSIPESPIPLVSVNAEVGLIENQRIDAHFYVTPDTKEVIGWYWTPALHK